MPRRDFLDACIEDISEAEGVETSLDTARTSAYATLIYSAVERTAGLAGEMPTPR